MSAHRARFADGSGLLFDDELQLMAVLPADAPLAPAPDTGGAQSGHGVDSAWRLRCPPALAPFLAPLQADCDAAPDDTTALDITERQGLFVVHGPRSGVRSSCARRDEVLPLVKTVLLAEILAEDGVAIHAAALERDGLCLLLPGAPGSGKSTLSAALLSAEFRFVTDDVLLLQRGVVRGLGLPVAVKPGSWPVLGGLFPELPALPEHRRPDGLMVKFLTPERIAAPDRVGWIIFPRYQAGASCRVESIPQSAAFGRLIGEAHSPAHRLRGEQFYALAHWIRDARSFDLSYGNLADGISAVATITKLNG